MHYELYCTAGLDNRKALFQTNSNVIEIKMVEILDSTKFQSKIQKQKQILNSPTGVCGSLILLIMAIVNVAIGASVSKFLISIIDIISMLQHRNDLENICV